MTAPRAFALLLALPGCMTVSDGADETGLSDAPARMRAPVAVVVDGQELEVRRTRAYIPVGTSPVIEGSGEGASAAAIARQPGESPDGEPAIAVSGLTRGPGAQDLAYFAILSACDIGADEAGRDWERFGIIGDLALWSPEDPGTLLIPMRYCPALDEA